ncbi:MULTISPECIES: hypothetical protein [Roseomonadaceae]|uniref:Uncharacterized protein n=1 Tax=Falsiroseomonas oleicola TaxID=2801474 RepID=A0ABS6H9I1_9PROT|nr:hypothetical protein [Roseomonas oleicola]MBU8545340.1 hypothetical protein [Roseomonas oleicola]
MSNLAVSPERSVEWVTLLDGRRFEIDVMGRTIVPTDTGDHLFEFTWSCGLSDCHRSAVTLLTGLLATHSVQYASQCTRYLGSLVAEADEANGGPVASLQLAHLSDWPASPENSSGLADMVQAVERQ